MDMSVRCMGIGLSLGVGVPCTHPVDMSVKCDGSRRGCSV